MSQRLRPAELFMVALFFLFALAVVPTAGPSLLAAAALGALVFVAFAVAPARARRPEYVSAVVVAASELVLAGGILLADGRRVLLVALLMGPMWIGASVWPLRAVVLGTVATGGLMIGLAFAVDPAGVLQTPARAFYPVAVMIATVVLASAAREADVASRATAVVDRLTGLLNRAAMLPRGTELAHQAELAGEPVGLVLADVDHFKEINDRRGHETGDEALVGVANRLREAVGTAGTLYRFGGEELVALLPGTDLAGAGEVAERMRGALARAPLAGLEITASFGVAAWAAGRPFELEALLSDADRALYEAKGRGRNCVCVATEPSGERDARRAASARARRDGDASAAATAALSDAGQRHASGPPAAGAVTPIHTDAASGNWLVRDDAARAHMLDLIHRIRRMRILAYAVSFAALLASGPSYGWWPNLPLLASAVVTGVVLADLGRWRRPELAIAATVVFSLFAQATTFLLAHGSPFPALPALIVSMLAWGPAFPARGVLVMAAIDALLLVGSGIAINAQVALSDPIALGVPLALVAAAARIGSALGRSSIDHRGAALVDQLTGMLNRRALEARVAAVTHEVAYSREPVALLVGDVDHFKQINDRAGHATGDAVLREVAYRMRKSLRAFEAAYRVGGEEFVVLLVGVGPANACEIAERLRAAIRSEPLSGVAVTMSFGVASCEAGDAFEYGALFERADVALYEAKAAGRDRVALSRGGRAPEPAAQAIADVQPAM